MTTEIPASVRTTERGRDTYVDFVRAVSLLVVVVWHWAFTVLEWSSDGPNASNPIGSTFGMWMLTWILQVLPLFFFVGGFASLRGWEKVKARGGGYRAFVGKRAMQLLIPTSMFLAFALVLRIVAGFVFPDVAWLTKAIILLVSPLWFLAIYLVLIVLTPLLIWFHERFAELVLVFLLALVGLVDVARFSGGNASAAYFNLLFVWALCYQAGFFYTRLVAAPRRTYWMFFWSGLLTLLALTSLDFYPLSMVGVPGDRISNMAPPTLCIIALLLVQIGVAMLIRDRVLELLERPGWKNANDLANVYSLPVYMWHTTGFAIAYGVTWLLAWAQPQVINWKWWVQRPVWLILPAIFTIPIVWAFSKLLVAVMGGKRRDEKRRADPDEIAA